ncbi:MAG: MFS transporter [Myxococcales bacterium]|nr:MFS transporter [Myxococcales bacterium]
MALVLRRIFAPRKTEPRVPARELDKRYKRWRRLMFWSATLGYGFYYICRLPLSVTKSKLVDAKILDAAQLGRIGSGHKVAYAMGKLTNGFLADRLHLGRFLAAGMFGSALLNLTFGLQQSYGAMLVVWALNGWLQAHGAPTCGVILASWFSDRERGKRYAVWSLSHHIGEALTFAVTAQVVQSLGWRAGFIVPAITCFVIVLVLLRTTTDRPAGVGLPYPSEYMNDRAPDKREISLSVWQLQREVLKSGWVWLLALSSASMYVARYAVNDWGVLYLEKAHGYSLADAGSMVSLFPIVGAIGSASSGWLSDRFFDSRRTPLTVMFGLLLIGSQIVLYYVKGNPWLARVAISCAGIGIGALLVFLGGLTAMDIAPRRAPGAALGLVGNCSYLGAAMQDWVSGSMIEERRKVVDGKSVYDFTRVRLFWIGASVVSTVLASLLWLPEKRMRRQERDGDSAAPEAEADADAD